jgi:hypothetical protein
MPNFDQTSWEDQRDARISIDQACEAIESRERDRALETEEDTLP